MVVLRSSLIGFVVLGLVLGLDLPATQGRLSQVSEKILKKLKLENNSRFVIHNLYVFEAQQCQGTCVKDPKTCIAEGGVMVTPCSETEICCDSMLEFNPTNFKN